MIASGASERGLSEVTIATSASSAATLPMSGPLAAIAIAAGAEDDDHAARARGRAPRAAPSRASRACARSRRPRRNPGPRRSPRSGPELRSTAAMPSAIASSSTSSRSPAATAPSTFSTLKRPRNGVSMSIPPARNELPRAAELEPVRPDLGVVGEPEGDERRAMEVAQVVGEKPAPVVADVHGRRRRLRACEEPPLRLEVLLHRPVQVEVVLAQVREDERVEAHTVEAPQRRSVRARLDCGAAVSGVEHLPEEPLQVDRLGRRERRRSRLAAHAATRRCRRARAGDPPRRGSRAAGTPSSSSRSSRSRPRARAPSSARRRTRPPRPPSTRARTATRSCGTSTSSGRSTTTATAPRSIASHARSCPSTRSPRTQKKSAPSETRRVSYARSLMSTGRPPVTSLGARARIRASSSTAQRLEKAQQADQRVGLVRGASCGISRRWRLKRAISRNAGAATTPP